MKTSLFAGSIGMLAIAAAASASPVTGMSIETVENGIAGQTTHRIYANLEAGARLDAVYGNGEGALEIYTSDGSSFYQNNFGGDTSLQINPQLIPVFPSLAFDSFVTIGLLDSGNGNALLVAGFADGGGWGAFNSAGYLGTSNGSWLVTPNDAQGAESDGRVLIGQFTANDGVEILGQVNLQGSDAAGNTYQVVGATWVPAPGALALLGVAGMAGRRRRRG
ncbi:MAG: hypothetical protein MK101_11830 [Phycisphaerales bacterium]|nr:hypothetical protein [Phycisphaerales bacterium]